MLRMLLAVVSSSIRVLFPLIIGLYSQFRTSHRALSLNDTPVLDQILFHCFLILHLVQRSVYSSQKSSKIPMALIVGLSNPHFRPVEISRVGIQLGSCSAASTCWTATSTSTTALWCGLGTWKAGKPLRLLGVSHWISTISIVKLTTTDLDHWISSLRGEWSWFSISLHICVNLLESTAQIDVQNHRFLIWSHKESTFQLKLQVMNRTYYTNRNTCNCTKLDGFCWMDLRRLRIILPTLWWTY